jgi:hypothetical protein
MAIERFTWTIHAEGKCRSRLLHRAEVERVVRAGHGARRINRGRADWMTQGLLADGRRIVVVYDHPNHGDRRTAQIVSVWDLSNKPQPGVC